MLQNTIIFLTRWLNGPSHWYDASDCWLPKLLAQIRPAAGARHTCISAWLHQVPQCISSPWRHWVNVEGVSQIQFPRRFHPVTCAQRLLGQAADLSDGRWKACHLCVRVIPKPTIRGGGDPLAGREQGVMRSRSRRTMDNVAASQLIVCTQFDSQTQTCRVEPLAAVPRGPRRLSWLLSSAFHRLAAGLEAQTPFSLRTISGLTLQSHFTTHSMDHKDYHSCHMARTCLVLVQNSTYSYKNSSLLICISIFIIHNFLTTHKWKKNVNFSCFLDHKTRYTYMIYARPPPSPDKTRLSIHYILKYNILCDKDLREARQRIANLYIDASRNRHIALLFWPITVHLV